METLPLELLLKVVARLTPRDLVAARKVCRAWRAVVTNLEARDRGFRFPCGLADVIGLTAEAAPSTSLSYYDDGPGPQWSRGFPCTCGAISDTLRLDRAGRRFPDLSHDRLGGTDAQYGHAHLATLPLATWECLARERALATKVVALGDSLWTEVQTYQYDHAHGGGIAPAWVPCWIWLPDDAVRPTSRVEVTRAVKEVLSYCLNDSGGPVPHPVDAILRDPAQARALYARADPDDEAVGEAGNRNDATVDDRWKEGWRVAPGAPTPDWMDSYSYDRNLRGWARLQYEARKTAANWRSGCRANALTEPAQEQTARRRDNDHDADADGDGDGDGEDEDEDEDEEDDADDDHDEAYRFNEVEVNGVPWKKLSQAQTIAILDGAVDAVDRIQAEVSALVRHSTVVQVDHVYWMGGLSPSGCLVGALTVESESD